VRLLRKISKIDLRGEFVDFVFPGIVVHGYHTAPMEGLMRFVSIFLGMSLLLTVVPELTAQENSFQDDLLEHKIGTWVMTGTIGGQEITHDLEIEWVLAHQYVRIHEISRELDSTGNLQYEAYVHIGWDPELKQYACLWLDITGTSGFRPIGHAVRNEDSLPFVFDMGDGNSFITTFFYDEEDDIWRWTMDARHGDETKPFARVQLRRKN
jgi:hypothetical protein